MDSFFFYIAPQNYLFSKVMKDELSLLIEEAIKLELYVSKLYMVFYRKFPDDGKFWWKLAIEEQNHAALLKTVRQMNNTHIKIPADIVPAGLTELTDSIKMLMEAIEEFEVRPDRTRAFQFAFKVEHSAGELHYESFMKYASESRLNSVFRKLNGDDINHAGRIQQYMIDHHIPQE